MSNVYETGNLQQKLYLLNVIHDCDHDFSTTKFANRLAKIGKRIHDTALSVRNLESDDRDDGYSTRGGGILRGGDNTWDDIVLSYTYNNNDFVSMYTNITHRNNPDQNFSADDDHNLLFFTNLVETEKQLCDDIVNMGFNTLSPSNKLKKK